jgi:hypothetical protein
VANEHGHHHGLSDTDFSTPIEDRYVEDYVPGRRIDEPQGPTGQTQRQSLPADNGPGGAPRALQAGSRSRHHRHRGPRSAWAEGADHERHGETRGGVPVLGVPRPRTRRRDGTDALAPRLSRAPARRHRHLTPQAEALTEPLRQTTEELGLPDLGDEALYLWNALFDPRDILDLIKSGRTEDEAATRLVTALRGALIGWAEADRLPLD